MILCFIKVLQKNNLYRFWTNISYLKQPYRHTCSLGPKIEITNQFKLKLLKSVFNLIVGADFESTTPPTLRAPILLVAVVWLALAADSSLVLRSGNWDNKLLNSWGYWDPIRVSMYRAWPCSALPKWLVTFSCEESSKQLMSIGTSNCNTNEQCSGSVRAVRASKQLMDSMVISSSCWQSTLRAAGLHKCATILGARAWT